MESHGPGKEASRRPRRRKRNWRERWSTTVLCKSRPQASEIVVLRKPCTRIRLKQGLEASGSLALRKPRSRMPLEVSSSGSPVQEASGSRDLGSLGPRQPQEDLGWEVLALREDRTQVCVGLVGQGRDPTPPRGHQAAIGPPSTCSKGTVF